MTTTWLTRSVLLPITAVALSMPSLMAAPPTDFTYQGQLKHRSVPVNGEGRFAFTLWDAEQEGRQIGPTVEARLEIVNGLFTAPLDFGSEAFNGEPRWLEITVGTPQGEGTLTPRQPITPAPFALHALTAPPSGGSGELTLPFASTNAADETAIAITNIGLGRTAAFTTDNPGNTQAAVGASTTGTGPALFAVTTGGGPAIAGVTGSGGGNAGWFSVVGPTAGQAALEAGNDALGSAAHFETTNPDNSSPVLVVETSSNGTAGEFSVNKIDSTADALSVSTNGDGTAIHVLTGGMGRAAFFEVDNIGFRTDPALEVVTNGRSGGAGLFRTSSILNTSTALTAEAAGNGKAIQGTAKGTGAAVMGYNAFGGDAVVGLVEGNTGNAGSFRNTDGTNPDPTVEVIRSGSGAAGRFENTSAGGLAGEFVGDVLVVGTLAADSYQFTSPQQETYSVGPMDFIAASDVFTVDRYIQNGAALRTQDNVSESSFPMFFLAAPVHLPDGALVTEVTFYANDTNQWGGVVLELWATPIVGGGAVVMARGVSPNEFAEGIVGTTDSTIEHAVIDNDTYAYFLKGDTPCLCGGSMCHWCVDMKVVGAAIKYEISEAD